MRKGGTSLFIQGAKCSGKLRYPAMASMVGVLIIALAAGAAAATRLGERTLGPGNWGADVFELQMRLRDLGYDITADGRFGPRTKQAVMAFQKAKNLPVDGLVGRETALQIVARFGIIEHTVAKGDTLSGIARKYGVEQSDIQRFNTIGSVLKVGQVLRFPDVPKHQVQEGETLESIAAKYQTSPAQLRELNGLDEKATIARGMWLRLPRQEYW